MRIGKPKNKKSTRGRKTEYSPTYCNVVEQACAIGAKIEDLSKILDVTQPTISKWMRDNYDFFLAVKAGRDRFDTEHVESALLSRAHGYDKEITEDKITKDGDTIACTKTIHVAPDVGAAIFWLCNRQPQRWKQISQAKFQQMNLYTGDQPAGTNGKGNGNGKEKPIDGPIEPGDVREIYNALRESGAFDSGLSLPESTAEESTNTKIN